MGCSSYGEHFRRPAFIGNVRAGFFDREVAVDDLSACDQFHQALVERGFDSRDQSIRGEPLFANPRCDADERIHPTGIDIDGDEQFGFADATGGSKADAATADEPGSAIAGRAPASEPVRVGREDGSQDRFVGIDNGVNLPFLSKQGGWRFSAAIAAGAALAVVFGLVWGKLRARA